MIEGVAIRRCEPADLAALAWAPELDAERGVIAWAFDQSLAGAMVMLVAAAGGAVVGQVWVDLARKPGVGVLWALRVREAWRGRGIGRRLVAAGEAAAAAAGARQTELAVEPANTRARALYERLGYRRIGRERGVHAVTGAPLGTIHDVLRRPLPGSR